MVGLFGTCLSMLQTKTGLPMFVFFLLLRARHIAYTALYRSCKAEAWSPKQEKQLAIDEICSSWYHIIRIIDG